MKYLFRLFSVLVIAATLGSCAPTPASGGSSFIDKPAQTAVPDKVSKEQYTIALVMKTLTNPFFVEMEKGARQAESELNVKLIVKTAAQETSIQQQIEIVEELIKSKVDAIVIAPGDSKELIPVLKKAQDARIQVVNIDNRLDEDLAKQLGLTGVPFISVDNEAGAYQSAKFLSASIKTPTQAVILEGIRQARNAQDRANGALRAFKENPNITLVASESANWKIDEAHDVAARLFLEKPEIGAVFCANDMMALGVIQYLNENQKTGVVVAGFDNLQEARQAVREGKLQATIDQQAALQGYTGVQFAVKLLRGEKVAPATYVDIILVTKATLK